MRTLLLFLVGFVLLDACRTSGHTDDESSTMIEDGGVLSPENVMYHWTDIALVATAKDTELHTPRPTITSRYLGLVCIAIFDAWSRYDEKADPVYLEGVARRPEKEHLTSNKEEAISYAAYLTLLEYYPESQDLFKEYMEELRYPVETDSFDPGSPMDIGLRAAKAVIKARTGDGSNHYGEETGSDGVAYFDYTGYEPVNPPDENTDVERWQPKYFSDGADGRFAPPCLTPYWQHVEPVTMDSSSQFRPGPPPELGSDQLDIEVREVVDLQAGLSDEEKALVEFMRDGPESVQQAGHWMRFAQDVSRRDRHTLDEDVKMFFYNQIVAMDAFIASWDAKMYYDYARPYAFVHELHEGNTIYGWGGEGQGFKDMDGSQWRPYSPETFLCPPFPSYVSGHSCVSGACGEALKLWTGDDHFGEEVRWLAGSLTEPEHLGDSVTLSFPTFTETAEMAGISRVLGGYHIQADNVEGLELGRKVAQNAWSFYQDHIGEETSE